MGRIRSLSVGGFRSIDLDVTINFPEKMPIVLVGENNAGKSNILRALDLVLGESWPGNQKPDDHWFYGRNQQDGRIIISIEVAGVTHVDGRLNRSNVSKFVWEATSSKSSSQTFSMVFSNGSDSRYVSNETRNQCLCIYIAAERRLSYQLSYSSKYTFLSKLMRLFHDRLVGDDHRLNDLKKYFAQVQSTFAEVEEFAAFRDDLQSEIRELTGGFSYGLEIDFSAYDPSNYFHALRVQATENGEPRSFDELGSGQEQVLALAFVQAYARAFRGAEGLTLVIDEPESNLHPLAQRWLARRVRDLAASGVQVILSTHSPAFLNILALPGLAVVRKEANATEVVQLTASELSEHCLRSGASKADPETILPFYAAAATEEILAGFFARKVVLVEGPTESAALPVLLEQAGLTTEKEGIAIVPVTGIGNLPKWWRLFTAYDIPTYVVLDNDGQEDGDSKKHTELLDTLGVPKENQSVYTSTTEWLVTPAFAVMGKDYETALRAAFAPDYARHEATASEIHGFNKRSKPLLARYVAEQLDISAHPEGAQKLRELADALRSLPRPSALTPPQSGTFSALRGS